MSKKGKGKKGKDGIILIVEGRSDQTALEGYLELAFADCRIKTGVYKGDPTTGLDKKGKVIPNYNPKKEVAAIAMKVMLLNGWEPQYVKSIIHVTDTDGAYVDESYVIEDTSISGKTLCKGGMLLSKNPEKTRYRNRLKRRFTLELLSQSKLRENGWDIDYQLFFMSTNLEHVTQGTSQHFSPAEKDDLAKRLRDRILENDDYASRIFYNRAFSGKTYDQTWDFILSGSHSLERHTNLGLLFSGKNSEIESG